jgi:spore coat protein U-like protein
MSIPRSMAAAAVSAVAIFAAPADAANTSANLAVNATVTANCTVSTSALAFGSIDTLAATAATGTGGVTVACTNGTAWTAAANAGAGTGATFSGRRMTSSGGSTLNYNLFTTGAHAVVWGDGTSSTATLGNTGNGAAQTLTIYGRIPAGQTTVPAGSYADTVAVTITY